MRSSDWKLVIALSAWLIISILVWNSFNVWKYLCMVMKLVLNLCFDDVSEDFHYKSRFLGLHGSCSLSLNDFWVFPHFLNCGHCTGILSDVSQMLLKKSEIISTCLIVTWFFFSPSRVASILYTYKFFWVLILWFSFLSLFQLLFFVSIPLKFTEFTDEWLWEQWPNDSLQASSSRIFFFFFLHTSVGDLSSSLKTLVRLETKFLKTSQVPARSPIRHVNPPFLILCVLLFGSVKQTKP